MYQVQEGLIPTFAITLPELFTNFIDSINFYQVELPFLFRIAELLKVSHLISSYLT